MREMFTDLRRSSGALVLTSSQGSQMSLEANKLQNGVFTHCIIEGLRNGTANQDGDDSISASELQTYLAKAVPKYVEKLMKEEDPSARVESQQTSYRSINLELDWRIW